MIRLTDKPWTLADLRKRGVRIDQLAARCGVPAPQIERWLAGGRPALWIRREIATALGVEPHTIWTGDDDR